MPSTLYWNMFEAISLAAIEFAVPARVVEGLTITVTISHSKVRLGAP
ncbi:MAG: hypothetical protein U7126_05390 [Microcoleus sp.]